MFKDIKNADPCVMVIFGATGDLTKRKLFPALYNLAKDDFLPHKFSIIGVGRQEMTSDEFRGQIIANFREFIPKGVDEKLIKWFEERIYYTGGDFNDDKKLFGDLKELLGEVTAVHQIPDNYFFYLATPPTFLRMLPKKSSAMASAKKRTDAGGALYTKNRSATTLIRPKN